MPVFISHSQKDEAAYSSLCVVLDSAKIQRWNPQQMLYGASLSDQLRSAIDSCELCIFIATKRSVESQWCNAEAGAFWGAGKKVILFLADSTLSKAMLPPQFQGDLWTQNAGEIVQAAHAELAKSRRPSHGSMKAACCVIEGGIGRESATGYLVHSDLVATVPYALSKMTASYKLKFYGGQERSAVPLLSDADTGVAILSLQVPVNEVLPVPIAHAVAIGDSCYGLGYAMAADGVLLPYRGEVVATDVISDAGMPTLLLHSAILATGVAHGMGGGPVWTDEGVIGHLVRYVSDPDQPLRPMFGLFYLVPATTVS